jgi:uncharacterized protein (DUF488 family)
MCAETLWRRCHRRLIADAATIGVGTAVWHLGHEQRVANSSSMTAPRMVNSSLY